MTVSVVQNQTRSVATSGTSGSTSSPSWSPATTAGNLLICSIAQNNNTAPSSVTGWTLAVTAENTNSSFKSRVDVYWKIAAGSDASPTVVLSVSGILYVIGLVEVTGVNTSATDCSGLTNGTISGSSLTATTSSATTAAGDFVYGAAAAYDSASMTAGVWSAATFSGSATKQADLNVESPGTSSIGLSDAWALGGSSGTSPSYTATLSAGTDFPCVAVVCWTPPVVAPTGNFFALF